MKPNFKWMLAAAGLICLGGHEASATPNTGDSTLQAAHSPAATRYLKKHVRTLAGDEPETYLFTYDSQHRLTGTAQKDAEQENKREFAYNQQGQLSRMVIWSDGKRHAFLYQYSPDGSAATGTERIFEDGDDDQPISTVNWKFTIENGQVTQIKKDSKDDPEAFHHQVIRYEGKNVRSIASVAANGKDTVGVMELVYGKKTNPYIGARMPLLMHPAAMVLLMSDNEVIAMSFRSKQAKATVTTRYEYKYDGQGYPVSGVEKDGGEVSATETFEYQ